MAGYDPNLDRIIDGSENCVITGKNGNNATYVFVRSYNNGVPKIDINRHQPNQQNAMATKSIRLDMAEIPFIVDALQKLYAKLQSQNVQPGQSQMATVQQRPHPDQQRMMNPQQYSQMPQGNNMNFNQQPFPQNPPQQYQNPPMQQPQQQNIQQNPQYQQMPQFPTYNS